MDGWGYRSHAPGCMCCLGMRECCDTQSHICTTYAPHIHHMHTTYTLHAHHIYIITYAPHAHHICTTCTPHIHHMYTTPHHIHTVGAGRVILTSTFFIVLITVLVNGGCTTYLIEKLELKQHTGYHALLHDESPLGGGIDHSHR